VDPLFKADEVPYYVEDSGAKCLITHLEKDEIAGKLPSEVDVINVREVQEVCESDEFEKSLEYMILKKMNLHCFIYLGFHFHSQGCDAYNGLLSYVP